MSIEAYFVRKDYRLSDAFRPRPGWGSMTATCPDEKVIGVSDEDLIAAARTGTPFGYRLLSVVRREQGKKDKILWIESPKIMLSPKPDQPETEEE